MKIVPTLFATQKKELFRQYDVLKDVFSYFHIDVMQKKFVGVNFFNLEILKELEKNNHSCEVHLMVSEYKKYCEKLVTFSSVKKIILHLESFGKSSDDGDDDNNEHRKKEIQEFISKYSLNYPSTEFILALDVGSVVEECVDCISYFSSVMVMGVKAGAQGQKFVEGQLQVIRVLKKLGCDVSVDGGINKHTISMLENLNVSQVNIGSYLNISKDIKEVKSKIRELHKYIRDSKLNEGGEGKQLPILIVDIGGTYTKIFRGFASKFLVEDIERVKTASFKSVQKMIEYVANKTKYSNVIFSVAGEKRGDVISMTHQKFTFNRVELERFFDCEVALFNDCELAGYGVKSNQKLLKTKSKNDNNSVHIKDVKEGFHMLEVLIIIGTGLGMCHISNSGVVYNSQGGHIYANSIDIDFFSFLQKELHKKGEGSFQGIVFDDILSSKGLEMRYYYDTSQMLSSYEIVNLAKKKDEKVKKTITFFLQELYYFLQDCIMFDNIISKVYLGGDFLHEILELSSFYLNKQFRSIESRVTLEIIDTNYLQFLGALNMLHKSQVN